MQFDVYESLPIFVFNALAGAGKTYALAKYADELARTGKKILFVQPTIQLIDNTYRNEFLARWKPTYRIQPVHSGSDNFSRSVKSEILNRMRAEDVGGELLLITHEAFKTLPRFRQRQNWMVLMDEVPSVDDYTALNLADHHSLLTKQLFTPKPSIAYSRLTRDSEVQLGVNEVSLRRLAENKREDGVSSYLQQTARRLISDNWEVYTDPSKYKNLLDGNKNIRQLGVHSLLTPRMFAGYEKVIIASALFYESILYHLWSKQGWAVFRDCNRSLYESLRYENHTNGTNLTINYLMNTAWSKRLRDKPFLNPKTGATDKLIDHLGNYLRDKLDGKPFVWMGNTDLPDDYFGTSNDARLPNTPHGLNNYQNYHHAVVISALNPAPPQFTFMATLGIGEEELRTYYYRSAVYQAAMRISLRNPLDTNPKSITVMDRDTAYWLQELFEGSQIASIGGIAEPTINKVGRRKIHANPNERLKAWRKKTNERKAELLTEVREINGSDNPTSQKPNQNGITVFVSKYKPVAADTAYFANYDEVIANLRKCHSQDVASKEANALTSAAIFDPNKGGADTKRGNDNITHINAIWLDNDGGNLTYQEFATIFSTLRMVIMNTHSSTKENPRWRCYIPISEAVGVKTHDMIIQNLMQKLAEHRFYGKKYCDRNPEKQFHGFDEGKFAPCSLFYLPCQAANANNSFFMDYKKDREILSVQDWIYDDIRPLEIDEPTDEQSAIIPPPTNLTKTRQQSMIDTAVASWRNSQNGEGNDALFTLGVKLRSAGLGWTEIAQTLRAEARFGNSPRDRLQQVNGIMNTLQKPYMPIKKKAQS